MKKIINSILKTRKGYDNFYDYVEMGWNDLVFKNTKCANPLAIYGIRITFTKNTTDEQLEEIIKKELEVIEERLAEYSKYIQENNIIEKDSIQKEIDDFIKKLK